jgi:hypothetical protein
MINGNGVRDESQQLRDIQDLIAKLADVNKKLALPIRAMPTTQPAEAKPVDAQSA